MALNREAIQSSEVTITKDGSPTLFIKSLGEPYHSVNGALAESMHVFIKNGLLYRNIPGLTIFEVGFGTGLNCLLSALEADKCSLKIDYIGVEKFPLGTKALDALNYADLLGGNSHEYWGKIHSSDWGKKTAVSGFFSMAKLNADIHGLKMEGLPGFDVVFFDAFAPGIQPEMWDTDIFQKIFGKCNKGAVLTTYSAKGEVRRRLASAGFSVERIPGPPGKKEMLRAIKDQ
jgi:tRNA U34 5-methylaminomethyl-2-thiouridine-forming methyltransferase MnmC